MRRKTTSSARAFAGKLALSGLGILMALLLLELGVRLVAPQNLDFYNGEKIMRRSDRPGQRFEFIPKTSNDFYIGVPVRINSQGLRDREIVAPKPDGVFRVLALGDSVTFGFGVRLEETYVKRLERHLNESLDRSKQRVEVVNAGIEGTGLDYYFQFLRNTGPLLEPDLVLVGLVLNDIGDYDGGNVGPSTQRSTAFVSLAGLSRRIRLRSHLYAVAYSTLKSVLYRTGILDINRVYADNFLTLAPPSERQARAWNSTLLRLDALVDLARSFKVSLVLIVFPMEMQLSAQTHELYRQTLGIKLDDELVWGAPQRRLAEFAQVKDVPLIDLLPSFQKFHARSLFLRNRWISHDWAHPSPEGHAVAAEEIFRALDYLRLVPTPEAGTIDRRLAAPRH